MYDLDQMDLELKLAEYKFLLPGAYLGSKFPAELKVVPKEKT